MATNYPVKVSLDPASLPTSNKFPRWNNTKKIFEMSSVIYPPSGSVNSVITHTGADLLAESNLLFNDATGHVSNNTLTIKSDSGSEWQIQMLDLAGAGDNSGIIHYKESDRKIVFGDAENGGTKVKLIEMQVADGYVLAKRFGGYTNDGNYINFDSSASRIDIILNSVNEYAFIENGSDGDFEATGDIISYVTSPSDKKLKYEIKPIENSLDIITKLQGRRFKWKKNDREDIGLIAQEVEKVLPEIVKEKQTLKDGEGETTKLISYQLLTSVLIEGVKELNKEIKSLRQEINKISNNK